MEIEKERMERRKVRKRMKNKVSTSQAAIPLDSTSTTEMEAEKKPEEGGDLEDESFYRKKELEELEALISPDVKADIGASPTGLYELIGKCESPKVLSGNQALLRLTGQTFVTERGVSEPRAQGLARRVSRSGPWSLATPVSRGPDDG